MLKVWSVEDFVYCVLLYVMDIDIFSIEDLVRRFSYFNDLIWVKILVSGFYVIGNIFR